MMISYEPTPLLPLPLPSPILHWKVDSLPLDHQGVPLPHFEANPRSYHSIL